MGTTHNDMDSKAAFFFEKASKWQKAYRQLRKIATGSGLAEELKWGCPCYTFEGKNIVLIHGFKEYCAFLFFKGALLKDPEGVLIRQSENVQLPRQVRFADAAQVRQMKLVLKALIKEAIEVEKAGIKVPLKGTSEYKVPEEFSRELRSNAALRKAFKALSPGRQRGYLLYFSQPRQSKTRIARIEKYLPHILHGRGLNDPA